MKKFDAIVIGTGQAGTPLVKKLSEQGKTVLIVEKGTVGGTCVNSGCTPTKTYLASARRMWDIANAQNLGVDISASAQANLKKIKTRKDDIVKASVKNIRESFEHAKNVTFLAGEAKFVSNFEVEINEELFSAEHIFINVGARATVPKQFQNVDFLTNESILDLTELPSHLIIIGASYIGLEFGQMFARFGSKVTIIEKSAQIISREDKETSDAIREFMEADGVKFVMEAQHIETSQQSGVIEVIYESDAKKHKIHGSHLLLAIGRTPNSDTLNLLATEIKSNEKGYIDVDDFCQTIVPNIFAMGDCNGKGAFTHTAYNDHQIVFEYLFEKKSRKISDRIMTYGLFTDPPLGRAGLTKKQAVEQGFSVLEGKRLMSEVSRAVEKGEANGFMQVLIDEKTDKILGAAVLGVGGDEIITSILNVMAADMPYTLIRDTMVLHPTVSELIPTLLETPKKV
ncbi:mercuric reductase [Flavobacterium noncentrifugens]|uniref:Pyruvate/2-oxoglutarate dehydrogenase complex, dihydrolipoamide dehydrogenase (E3) component n=1 Tax=Flavobacterium noncentrifugens TaxID=1128970 RepID=A0A1G8USG4_9FLAO|nr:mercuric reductase [Flavobacterium noncentrifugens]GEP52596.1 mercuric reductase [Flavobacterium noncentrifugens]SDJ56604.1 Pyruvate/2-oxoglutarate dehydrogenase complex, dihydrolipoamide dehydrogenase (E3) component [Flavobacterium noncentrifugens]